MARDLRKVNYCNAFFKITTAALRLFLESITAQSSAE